MNIQYNIGDTVQEIIWTQRHSELKISTIKMRHNLQLESLLYKIMKSYIESADDGWTCNLDEFGTELFQFRDETCGVFQLLLQFLVSSYHHFVHRAEFL